MRSTKSPSWIERRAGLRPGAVAAARLLARRRAAALRPVRARPPRLPPARLPRGGRCRATRSSTARWAGRCAIRRRSGELVAGDGARGSPAACARPRWCSPTPGCGSPSPRAATCRKPPSALDEVLRWKLRRLVPFRVDELRVGATEVSAHARPGGAAPAAARLRRRAAPGPDRGGLRRRRRAPRPGLERQPVAARRLGAVAAAGAFSALVLVERGGVHPDLLPRAASRCSTATRGSPATCRRRRGRASSAATCKLTRNFLDEHFPGAPLGAVLLLAPPGARAGLARPAGGGARRARAAPVDGRHLPPLRAEEPSVPPWRSLAPMLGAARQEVA